MGCPDLGQSVDDGSDVGWFVGGEVVGCVDVGRSVAGRLFVRFDLNMSRTLFLKNCFRFITVLRR